MGFSWPNNRFSVLLECANCSFEWAIYVLVLYQSIFISNLWHKPRFFGRIFTDDRKRFFLDRGHIMLPLGPRPLTMSLDRWHNEFVVYYVIYIWVLVGLSMINSSCGTWEDITKCFNEHLYTSLYRRRIQQMDWVRMFWKIRWLSYEIVGR